MANCCNNNQTENTCTANIIVDKKAEQQHAAVGEVINYSISVINQSTSAVNNVVVIDPLAAELEFVPGSVMIGGASFPDADIVAGVPIGTVPGGQMRVVGFKAKVIALPEDGEICNCAVARLECQNEPDIMSNQVHIKVEYPAIQVIKSADMTVVSRGDVLNYTVKLVNTGTLYTKDLTFVDIMGEKDEFLPQTFRVDGRWTATTQNIIPGVGKEVRASIGSLAPGKEMLITYGVTVMGGGGCQGYITNKAYVTYSYSLPQGGCQEGESVIDSNSISEVELGLTTFKQMVIDGYVPIPDQKPDMEDINSISATADLLNCHVIKTLVAQSAEGQRLSGYKLIVRGRLNLSIEYTANVTEQSVHSAQYAIPISAFIVLPDDYMVGAGTDVEFIIEDIYYKAVDIRTVFYNTTILINVKSC